jgi:hypothetical protein
MVSRRRQFVKIKDCREVTLPVKSSMLASLPAAEFETGKVCAACFSWTAYRDRSHHQERDVRATRRANLGAAETSDGRKGIALSLAPR